MSCCEFYCMKNKTFWALLFAVLAAGSGIFCKKENKGIKVEYELIPKDQYVQFLAWCLQDTTNISDGSDWKDGKKTVYFDKDNIVFTTCMEVDINNITNDARLYDIFIWVEGELKATKQF